jgi:hypothetical protein
VAPPVFKTYAPGSPRLRRVTLLVNSSIFRRRRYAGLRRRSWEWALSGHSRRADDDYVDALVQTLVEHRANRSVAERPIRKEVASATT